MRASFCGGGGTFPSSQMQHSSPKGTGPAKKTAIIATGPSTPGRQSKTGRKGKSLRPCYTPSATQLGWTRFMKDILRIVAASGASLSGALVSLTLFSCYNPDYAGAGFSCDPSAHGADCPAGLSCLERKCRDPGAVPDLLMSLPPDLSMKPPADMPSVSPCKNTGVPVTPNNSVYACNGAFGDPIAPDDLCNSNFHVCNDKDDLSKVDDGKCRAVNGFYAAAINAKATILMNKTAVDCSIKKQDADSLAGCGSQPGTEGVVNDCHGLKSIFHCGDQSAVWSCMSKLDDASHMIPVGGVLCCPG